MTTLNSSVVIICPVMYCNDCNMIAELMGWGKNSFSVPLYTQGISEPTHYGLRSECDVLFIEWLRGKQELPGIVLRNKNIKKVLNEIILDVSPDEDMTNSEWMWGAEHFLSVCKKHSLHLNPVLEVSNINDEE